MLRRAFRAMGGEVELLLEGEEDDGAPALDEAERELRRLGAVLSRFQPESELSALNEAGVMKVGPELLELTELALDARERTGGRFDPTVHEALVAAGYDRSFEELECSAGGPDTAAPPRCGGAVAVDRVTACIELEPGFRLDLGGIAKGWAADRLLAGLRSSGPALVNVGGDLAAAGRPWPVGLDTPAGKITLELDRGGIATSGRDRRRWLRDGRAGHHLIDPSTARPAEGDLLTVTVAGPSAAAAEVMAKALFLAGTADRAAAEADERGIPTVLVTADGRTVLAGGLA